MGGFYKVGKKTGANKQGRKYFDKYSQIGSVGYQNLKSGNVVGLAQDAINIANAATEDMNAASNFLDKNSGLAMDVLKNAKSVGIIDGGDEYSNYMGQLKDFRQQNKDFQTGFNDFSNKGTGYLEQQQRKIGLFNQMNNIKPAPSTDLMIAPFNPPNYVEQPATQLMPTPVPQSSSGGIRTQPSAGGIRRARR
jgi:hypothetical protein